VRSLSDQPGRLLFEENLQRSSFLAKVSRCYEYEVVSFINPSFRGKKIISWKKEDSDAKPVQFILFSTVKAYFGDKMQINIK
jgi:hypothetical protein